jgi:hypothetical protein
MPGKVGKTGEEPPMFRAEAMLAAAEAKLVEHARTRWRLLCLRTVIDELHRRGGKHEGEILRATYAELVAIYYAQHAHNYVKPPAVRK